MSYRRWTPEETEKLRVLVDLQVRRRDIATHFPDRSYDEISRRMNYLGIKIGRVDPDAFGRHARYKGGLRVGCLSRSLKGAVRDAVAAYAVEHGVTAADAVQAMLAQRLAS